MSEKAGIYQAIPAIMAEVGAIRKNRDNKMQGYSFRGIDDVYFAFQPLLAKHKVFYVPNVTKQIREERQTTKGGNLIYTILDIEFTFFAEDGSSVKASTVGEAMDSGDKSANKAMSAALKYALLQIFCIPTEEPKDTENETHEVAPRIQANRPPQAPIQPPVGNPAYFRCTFGKYKGKTVAEAANADGVDGLANYVQFLEKKAAESKKPIQPGTSIANFIEAVAQFIADFENQVAPEAPGDDIPF